MEIKNIRLKTELIFEDDDPDILLLLKCLRTTMKLLTGDFEETMAGQVINSNNRIWAMSKIKFFELLYNTKKGW